MCFQQQFILEQHVSGTYSVNLTVYNMQMHYARARYDTYVNILAHQQVIVTSKLCGSYHDSSIITETKATNSNHVKAYFSDWC